ncbi:hypothetical protein RRG08_030151 [Elysia crispata]|uniref:Uncharacterized protein n=1 Tax=Elysia crispata TaxID=231223 RepID=A0AAE0ZR56_9GAST|nr:hypothetical protein RRG08_030151 [Elysia crispata]
MIFDCETVRYSQQGIHKIVATALFNIWYFMPGLQSIRELQGSRLDCRNNKDVLKTSGPGVGSAGAHDIMQLAVELSLC